MEKRSEREARIAQAIEAAWPDLLTNLQVAYADLVNTRFALEGQTTELRQVNDLLQQVFASMSEALFVLDNTNKIVQANPMALKLLGVTEQECLGRTLFDFFSASDMPGSIWQILSRSKQGVVTNYETHVRSQDGRVTPVSLSASVMRDRSERITGMLVLAMNIAERKRAEEALRRAHDQLELRVRQRTAELSQAVTALELEILERQQLEEKFRNLLEAAPDAVVIVNAAGEIDLVNSQTERLFGYHRSELLGRPVEILIPERFHEQHFWHSPRQASGTQVESIGVGLDLSGLRKDGHEFPIEISLSPLETEDGFLITSIIRDVTERKQAEEELRSSHERLRDLSGRLQQIREEERTRIAREIHDQLGGAMTSLKMELMNLNAHIDPEQSELISGVESISESISETIEMIRRIAADLRPPVLDTWGLPAAIEWQLQEFQSRSGIECHFDTGLEEVGIGPDTATAVFRVFQETLTNVARHAQATRVDVRLEEERNYLVLQVQDNGRGIDPSELEKKKSLGLLGMQERMRLISGKLEFRGSMGQGTTVLASVPLETLTEGNGNSNQS